jgi:hypothetical protein
VIFARQIWHIEWLLGRLWHKRKTGGVGGQARSDTQSRSHVLHTSNGPHTKAGQSGTGMATDDQKQQRSQTIRPQRPKIGNRKQNTSKTSSRLRRVAPTFDHLLVKYTKKKVVPHNRPIKQIKSKGDLCESKCRLKLAQKVVQQRSPGHPPPEMSWCFPVYSSPMCCPTVWGGTTMNPCYWPNPFTYSG